MLVLAVGVLVLVEGVVLVLVLVGVVGYRSSLTHLAVEVVRDDVVLVSQGLQRTPRHHRDKIR